MSGTFEVLFIFEMLGSYLGRGATWVVGVPYLCFGGTWVHVATEKYLFRLILSFAGFAVLYLCFSDTWVHVAVETNLPVFWLYLGTCYS